MSERLRVSSPEAINGVHRQIIELLDLARKHNVYTRLSARQRAVFALYYQTEFHLREVESQSNRELMKLLLETGIKRLVGNLPEPLQEEYSKRKVQVLKDPDRTWERKNRASKRMWASPEYRKRMKTILQDEDSREKRSKAQKGKKRSAETRRKISEASKKYWSDPETRARKMKTLASKKHRAKQSRYHRGKTHTEETRRKMSRSQTDKWEKDPEYRKKQEELHKSMEYREKLRIANTGKKRSKETRRKISEANRRRHAKLRSSV